MHSLDTKDWILIPWPRNIIKFSGTEHTFAIPIFADNISNLFIKSNNNSQSLIQYLAIIPRFSLSIRWYWKICCGVTSSFVSPINCLDTLFNE